MFLVPRAAKGVAVKGYSAQDGMRAADITFTGRSRRRCRHRRPDHALPLIERVVDEARTALCAEAVGAMDESLKVTVD